MTFAQYVIGPTVAGRPVVYLTGLVVLMLVSLPVTRTWVGSLVTIVHEGGHIVLAILSGRGPKGFKVIETTGGGETELIPKGWGVGLILGLLAGYLAPPLIGLAGASLVVDGKSWSVLWASFALLLGAWAQAADLFTGLVVLLAGAGIGWAAVAGPAACSACELQPQAGDGTAGSTRAPGGCDDR